MIEMTLSSRHRIRNSSPGGLRPSTLPLGHGGSPQFVVAEIRFKEAVITSSVVNIIYLVGEITFKVAVMTSLVAKFSLFVAKVTFVLWLR